MYIPVGLWYDVITMKKDQLVFPKTLESLKHGFRTNFKKDTCTNQDALTVILNHNGGTMSRKDMIHLMVTWRFGEDERYDYREVRVWNEKKEIYLKTGKFNKVLKMGFGYLFNSGAVGGYGFVGKDVHTRGYVMHVDKYNTSKCYNYWKQVKKAQRCITDEHSCPKELLNNKGHDYFRRTTYYKSSHGKYSLTLEGFKRLSELGFTQ